MGRVRTNIQVNGHECWTLFDSGSRRTYIVADAARGLDCHALRVSRSVLLGGRTHTVAEVCHLEAFLEGKPVWIEAYVTDEIGVDEDKRRLEILFGAHAMQDWGIELDLANEKLDMRRYPGELAEF